MNWLYWLPGLATIIITGGMLVVQAAYLSGKHKANTNSVLREMKRQNGVDKHLSNRVHEKVEVEDCKHMQSTCQIMILDRLNRIETKIDQK